jgi:hypothetical protein
MSIREPAASNMAQYGHYASAPSRRMMNLTNAKRSSQFDSTTRSARVPLQNWARHIRAYSLPRSRTMTIRPLGRCYGAFLGRRLHR